MIVVPPGTQSSKIRICPLPAGNLLKFINFYATTWHYFGEGKWLKQSGAGIQDPGPRSGGGPAECKSQVAFVASDNKKYNSQEFSYLWAMASPARSLAARVAARRVWSAVVVSVGYNVFACPYYSVARAAGSWELEDGSWELGGTGRKLLQKRNKL